MKIDIEKIISNPSLVRVAAEHFAYSMYDVHSYDELTPKEKSIISLESFELMMEYATTSYRNLKEKNPNAIILIRVGHFYNTYDDDADTIAKALGITLSQANDTHKASIPRHAIDTYLPKLIRAGHKVALCDHY